MNIFSKKIVEDKWYVMCGRDYETTWHTFFNCQYALEVWQVAGLATELESAIYHIDSAKELIFRLLTTLDKCAAKRFGFILW